MATRATVPAFTANQGRYILEKLIDETTASAADVRRHLAGMWDEMNMLEKRISELRGMASHLHPIRATKSAAKRVAKTTRAAAKTARRRARKVTPGARASRRLQGKYIAAIRTVPRIQRVKFAKIAKEEGREKAITAIRKANGN